MSHVSYKIQVADPLQHLFKIQIQFMPISEEDAVLTLPNWLPGSYMIRDFAKHVLDFKAQDENTELNVTPTSKSSYRISHNNKPITVTYHYYAFDLSVRKAYLDQQFGFINPASSCYEVEGLSHLPCHVEIVKPESYIANSWQNATGLKRQAGTERFGWGKFEASSYIDFTDYPILMGKLDIAEFNIQNIPHFMVTVGQHFGSLERVVKDLTPICEYQKDVFGGLPNDVEEYYFLTMVTDNGFGGLEHLNSTALVCSRSDIINDHAPITDGYQTFLSLCSHEYFHTWNVKRLKPREFVPYDLNQEVYTEQLWFYEGMTSYFDDYSLVATNTISKEKYLDTFAKSLTRIERGEGQTRQALSESSFFSWTKFYQQDHTAPDQITSYYVKGAALACFADLAIRHHSQNQYALTNVMADLWQQYGVNGEGTTQKALETAFKKYMSEEDFTTFLAQLHSPVRIDIKEVFSKYGLELSYHSQQKQNQWFVPTIDSTKDSGSDKTQSNTAQDNKNWWLGVTLAQENGAINVKQVLNHSPAQKAGIAVGDSLVAINNIRVNSTELETLLQHVAVNQDKSHANLIHYFRKDTLLCSNIELQKARSLLPSLILLTTKNWLFG